MANVFTSPSPPPLSPDYVDRNLTGKEPDYQEPGLPTFVAGFLRQIAFSYTFSKATAEVRYSPAIWCRTVVFFVYRSVPLCTLQFAVDF